MLNDAPAVCGRPAGAVFTVNGCVSPDVAGRVLCNTPALLPPPVPTPMFTPALTFSVIAEGPKALAEEVWNAWGLAGCDMARRVGGGTRPTLVKGDARGRENPGTTETGTGWTGAAGEAEEEEGSIIWPMSCCGCCCSCCC